jgi:hypothetical protein
MNDTTGKKSSRLNVNRPPETLGEREACKRALEALRDRYFNGNASELARELGYSRNAVQYWFDKGYMGATAALELEHRSNLTMKMMRPDIATRRSALGMPERVDLPEPRA